MLGKVQVSPQLGNLNERWWVVKTEIYTCDRCGSESNIEMIGFRCQFGRSLNATYSLPDLITGHFCRSCEAEWNNRFFKTMGSFIRGNNR